MDSSDDTLDACNDNDATVKHSGQLKHRFVHNFHVHETGEQTRCGTCGDEKVCLRCTHVGKKECETCGMFMDPENFAEHRRIHTGERPYKCAQCLASFKQKRVLVNHLRTHTGEKPFLCEVCGHRFRNQIHLDHHQASIHSAARHHLCEQCGKSYKLRGNLMRHKRKVHDQVYACRECNEILLTRNAFTEHCLIHSSEVKQEPSDEAEEVEDIVEGSSEESDDVKSEKIPE